MSRFIARAGNQGRGTTHLYPSVPRAHKVHGLRYFGTSKALCGAVCSAAAVTLGEVDAMPDNATKACPQCATQGAHS